MQEALKITLTRGLIGKQRRQKAVIAALGLGKYGSSVVHANSPVIAGMLHKVSHLVTVIPIEASDKKTKTTPQVRRKTSVKNSQPSGIIDNNKLVG